jgi:hypothetical protein
VLKVGNTAALQPGEQPEEQPHDQPGAYD